MDPLYSATPHFNPCHAKPGYIYPVFANSVDPDQLASKKPTNMDLHFLPFSMQIYSHNLNQVIWLAEN